MTSPALDITGGPNGFRLTCDGVTLGTYPTWEAVAEAHRQTTSLARAAVGLLAAVLANPIQKDA